MPIFATEARWRTRRGAIPSREVCARHRRASANQGGQGRTGAQTCAPRPAPPGPSTPTQMGEQGHPAAGPIRPSSPGSQALS
jgi:hypothetical protein